MRLGIVVSVGLLLGAGVALAQSIPPRTFSPVVPSGKTRQVGFFTTLNPDCTTDGDIDARIIKQATNGTVEIEQGQGFAFFAPNSPRAVCNTKQVQGIKVKYTSKEGFIGKDQFDVEFLAPMGQDVTWKYSVTIK